MEPISIINMVNKVRLPGEDFVGHGEAASEEAAQGIAAARFVKYLVENGRVSADDLPRPLEEVVVAESDAPLPTAGSEVNSTPVINKPHPPPMAYGNANSSHPPPPGRPFTTPAHFHGNHPPRAPPPPLATPAYFRSQPGPSAPPPPIQPPPNSVSPQQPQGMHNVYVCVCACACS